MSHRKKYLYSLLLLIVILSKVHKVFVWSDTCTISPSSMVEFYRSFSRSDTFDIVIEDTGIIQTTES